MLLEFGVTLRDPRPLRAARVLRRDRSHRQPEGAHRARAGPHADRRRRRNARRARAPGVTDERVVAQTRAAFDGVPAQRRCATVRRRLRADLGDRHRQELRSARSRTRDGDDSRLRRRARARRRMLYGGSMKRDNVAAYRRAAAHQRRLGRRRIARPGSVCAIAANARGADERTARVVLAVLDGWGCRDDAHGNAIAAAELPNWRALLERYPHTTLEASRRGRRPAERHHGQQRGRAHRTSAADASCRKASRVIDAAIADGRVRQERDAARVHRARRAQRRNAAPDGTALRRPSAQLARASLRADRRRGRRQRADRDPLLSRRARHAAAFGADATSSALEAQSRARRARRARSRASAAATTRWIATGAGSARSAHTTCSPRGNAAHRAHDARAAVRDAYARGENDEFVLPTIVGDARPIARRRRLHLLQLSARSRAPAHDGLRCRNDALLPRPLRRFPVEALTRIRSSRR